MSVLNHLMTKIGDVNLSDLNYELGKAKENLVCESENYFGNFKTDATLVTNIIKTESTRLNKTYFEGKIKMPSMQKSLSLPQFHFGAQNLQDQHFRTKDVSSESNSSDKDLDANTDKEYSAAKQNVEKITRDRFCETGEDQEYLPMNTSEHLKMCFIDDEDDDTDDELFPIAGGNFKYFDEVDIEEAKPNTTVKQLMQNAKNLKVKNLETKVKFALTRCKENALEKAALEKKKLFDEHPLAKLLGVQKDNWEMLEDYESDALRAVIEEFKVKISEYNEELVELIEEKDNLEQQREEIIVDIKDLSSIL